MTTNILTLNTKALPYETLSNYITAHLNYTNTAQALMLEEYEEFFILGEQLGYDSGIVSSYAMYTSATIHDLRVNVLRDQYANGAVMFKFLTINDKAMEFELRHDYYKLNVLVERISNEEYKTKRENTFCDVLPNTSSLGRFSNVRKRAVDYFNLNARPSELTGLTIVQYKSSKDEHTGEDYSLAFTYKLEI